MKRPCKETTTPDGLPTVGVACGRTHCSDEHKRNLLSNFASVKETHRVKSDTSRNRNRRENYRLEKLEKKLTKAGITDDLVAQLAKSKSKAFPQIKKMFEDASACARLKENINDLVTNGGRHKTYIVRELTAGLPGRFCVDELKITPATLKWSWERRNDPEANGARDREGRETEAQPLHKTMYPAGVRRVVQTEYEEYAMAKFFENSTNIYSGAETQTRHMSMPEWEWEMERYAKWPAVLRDLVEEVSECLPDASAVKARKKPLTHFEACLLAAVHVAETTPEFNADEEIEARRDTFRKRYLLHLARKRGMLPKASKAEQAEAQKEQQLQSDLREPLAWDPRKYIVTPHCRATFRAFLKRKKLRYTRFKIPHPCPLCTDGPTHELLLPELNKQLVKHRLDYPDDPRNPELEQRIMKLKQKLKLYRLHLQQLACARANVAKKAADLKPNEVMVTRDFVNHHDSSGKHVKCLIWVVQWRDNVGEPLKLLKLRHYCSDGDSMSTDSYYTADVMDFHFSKGDKHHPGLFDKFNRVYFVGDHGVHFACVATMYNEAKSYRVHHKEIVLMYLTSYHAFSRADGAGAEDSTQHVSDFRNGRLRLGGAEWTDMTNTNADLRSRAYHFAKINRNEDIFPSTLLAPPFLRKWNEVSFEYDGRCEDTEGILKYRLVSGEGVWKFADLNSKARDDMNTLCDTCSTAAQRPEFHAARDCSRPDPRFHNLPDHVDLQPDPTRIEGKQKTSRKRAALTKAQVFLCKVEGCKEGKRFRKPHTANRHMQISHGLEGTAFEALAYPLPEGENLGENTLARQSRRGRKRKKPRESSESDGPTEEETEAVEEGEERKADEEGEEVDDNDGGSDSDEDLEGQYEVEKIVAHKDKNGARLFKVKWKGYVTMTWEPEACVASAQEALEGYWEDAPLVPAPPKRRTKRTTAVIVEVGASEETLADKRTRMTDEYIAAGFTWKKANEKAIADLDEAAVTAGQGRRRRRC